MAEIPLSIAEAAVALRNGTLSCPELVAACNGQSDRLDGKLGTYLARFDDEALEAASRVDADFKRGIDRGPLQGIPVAIKDMLACAEGPTTAQSLIVNAAWGAGRDATAVKRLKQAGAVITGKTTTMEFASGFPDRDKPFPLPRNPWDQSRWAGGSSSGTANGIAAGLFLAGLGTDTGGSIRMPAAFCGVSGLMPTYGRVSKSGCIPLGFTLDHIGPMARSAWDCAAMLDTIAGYDESDPTSVDWPAPRALAVLEGAQDLEGLRVGVLREHHFSPESDPAVVACFDAAVAELSGLGASVVEVTVPLFEEMVAATLVTSISEALAYHRSNLRARWNDYFASTRELFGLGAVVDGADYVQAQRVRRVGQRALFEVFREIDVIATPTASIAAPTFEAVEFSGVLSILRDVHTTYWDGVGNPVLAIPIGFTAEQLPLSMQLAGRPFEEATVLRVGHAFQQTTDWHRRRPPTDASGQR
jgi:aspartyl-tRNA(Asn)/glutamyl-tRNA(Gln) amidotransferase subunit A